MQAKGANNPQQSIGSSTSSAGNAWLDVQNKLSECFEQFIKQFNQQFDLYFKTYDKNLSFKAIESQSKGSKKEKQRFYQFMIHEEKEYWKRFPRNIDFYHANLRNMHHITIERVGVATSKDVSLLITNILNILPIASRKYCANIRMEPVLHNDTSNKLTFDSIVESIVMFNPDGVRNWQLLGFTVTILCSDLILTLLEISQVQISIGVIEILLEICKYYSIVQNFQEEGVEEDTILDIYFKQIQVTWAKIFGNLSKMQFKQCLKFMNGCLLHDYRKLREEEIQVYAQRIYFCRFLQIVPVDKLMSNDVHMLMDNICNLLIEKHITPQFKNVLLMTLKFQVEQLQFYDTNTHPSSASRTEFKLDTPMGVLWPVIETMYQVAEKSRKKETLKDYALQLQMVIIKVSPEQFFGEKINNLVHTQKLIQSYFESKKTYSHGLQLLMEISCPKAQPYNKYQNWSPKIQQRTYLLQEDGTQDVVLPIKQFKGFESFKLMRRLLIYNYLPIPFADSFKLVYNSRNLPESLTSMNFQYLKQMAFEDLKFSCENAIPQMFGLLKYHDRYDIGLHALKLIDFMLNPLHDFKNQYVKLWQHSNKDASNFVQECLFGLQNLTSKVINELLHCPLMKSDYLQDLAHFFKSDEKDLCNDERGLIWCSADVNGDQEGVFRAASPISIGIKNKKQGRFHLEEEKRVISFEEFKEIQMMRDKQDNEYQNQHLNEIAQAIQQAQGQWDSQKERLFRYRVASHLSEERKEGQRQNTQQFGIPTTRAEESKLMRQILKMMHYMPQVQDQFKFFPLLRILNDDQPFLVNKVKLEDVEESICSKISTQPYNQLMNLSAEDKSLLTGFGFIQQASTASGSSLRSRRKSNGTSRQTQFSPRLREIQDLLPYFLLNLDLNIVTTAFTELQRLMVYGDFQTRISLIDQMLYLIKELLQESPEDYLVSQCLQQLIKMIKIWHASEKNKVKLTNPQNVQQRMLDGMEIISLQKSEQHENLSNRMLRQQYLFQTTDMISLLGMCSKDRLIRQLSVILMAESGKLQRLMIPKSDYKRGIYDIIYYNTEAIQNMIIDKLMIINCMRSDEFRSLDEMTRVVKGISPYHLIIDGFDYKKAGLNENMVRDIQIIMMGEVFIEWKKILLQPTSLLSVAAPILNFINILSQRTLHLFEIKSDNEFSVIKDFIGLNLLMAITLYNVSRSHLNVHVQQSPKQTENSSSDNTGGGMIQEGENISSQQTMPHILSTNSVLEDFQNLASLLEQPLTHIYQSHFGKFEPSRFPISSVILAFYYQLQDPYQPKSLENLKDIFTFDQQPTKPSDQQQQFNQHSKIHVNNYLTFNTLLTLNANGRFLEYVRQDKRQLREFAQKLKQYMFDEVQLSKSSEKMYKQRIVLLVNTLHSLVQSIIKVVKKENYANEVTNYITANRQYELLLFTKRQHDLIEANEQQQRELGWLLPKIKEIWHGILSFEVIFTKIERLKLDLKFLISLESQGYKVLKYYKYLSNPSKSYTSTISRKTNNTLQESLQQEFNINELKLLLNQIYLFYNTRQTLAELLMKKNPYYNCLAKNIIGTQALLQFLKQKNFNNVYDQLTSSCLRSPKALIETKLKSFIQYGLHSKFFLIGLFMSVNSMDEKVIQSSKIICLSVLPLMFEDEKFRETIESMICEHEDIESLIQYDNKNFYRFIKQVFKDEEAYNMKHHFEKYFSISGLLRNVLNEIIKLQTMHFSQRMLLKILEIITYFIGTMQLRRAPLIDDRGNSSFIFDNLIDYKSFEFLSKLYKISEKLVDHDDESIVMNLWFKVVEGKLSNFEILAKFLVHNLSSFIMKIKSASDSVEKRGSEYSLEYEKQKRYALSIFNYIKARTQQMDMRNSINLSANSITWSQKMIKLMSRAALNLQSKYVLEKIKLKKILQLLHSEINDGAIRLQLKGGLLQNTEFVNQANQRVSINMSDLLSSQTFLETFSAKNRQEAYIMKNLMFRIKRIMNDKFIEIAGDKSIEQMPEMIIKYLENSLVFITNDVERPTQVIKFSVKEELTIVIMMIILTVDLILGERNENRFYFLLETFNKLSIHVGMVAKYFNFKKNFTTDILFNKETGTNAKVWQIVNFKATIENFAIFTKLLFKIIQNLNSAPILQYRLIKMWLLIFQKHREQHQASMQGQSSSVASSLTELIAMKPLEALNYSRNLILTLIQNAYYNICEISRVGRDRTETEIKYYAYNFKQHFNCIIDYVIPSGGQLKLPSIQSLQDPESVHVAFASNAIFWIAFSCLEAASMFSEESQVPDLGAEFQQIGMSAITKVLEKSDFLKMLIGVSKLSTNFYSYSLTMSKNQTSFFEMIFNAIKNPDSFEDAMKCLIISIRVQDQQLLNAAGLRDSSEIELQRLLYLIPFLMQQFSLILHSQLNPSVATKTPIFGNYRSIILLLKKSLPSIGIDKKKDVFEQLDLILKEAEKNEEKLIKKEFKGLLMSTVSLSQQMGYQHVIFECERTFVALRDAEDGDGLPEVQMTCDGINEFIANNDMVMAGGAQKASEINKVIEGVFKGEILGEDVNTIVKEMKPLYFGLKNIILKEIDSIDKDIDIQRFFFDESALDNQDHQSVTNSTFQKSVTGFSKRSVILTSQPLISPGVQQQLSQAQQRLSDSQSPPLISQEKNNVISQLDQQQVVGGGTVEMPESTSFSNLIKKMNVIKRSEAASKYQNSQNAAKTYGYNTPKDNRLIRGITGIEPNNLVKQATLNELQPAGSIKVALKPPIMSKLQGTMARTSAQQIMFDDDDIHIPLERQISIGTSKSLYHGTIHSKSNLPHYDQEQDPMIEDEDAYPQFDDANNRSDNSFSRAQPEQFEVIDEEEQQKAVAAHSWSSEDPRELLKKQRELNRKMLHEDFPHMHSPIKGEAFQGTAKLGGGGTGLNLQQLQMRQSNASSMQEKVQEAQNTVYTGDDLGGIITFCKPKRNPPRQDRSPSVEFKPKQLPPAQFQTQPNFYPSGKSHTLVSEIALNPNYVADRTSQIFSEINETHNQMDWLQQPTPKGSYAQSQQNFYNHKHATSEIENIILNQQNKSQNKQQYPWMNLDTNPEPFSDVRSQKPQQTSQNLKIQNAYSVALKANSFFESIQNEELSIYHPLSQYLTDQIKRTQFENFLRLQEFDLDYIQFYTKVKQFKQEIDMDKAYLVARKLIELYLTDESEFYLGFPERLRAKVINDFGLWTQKKHQESVYCNFNLFDTCTYAIERDIMPFIDQFKQQE